MSPVRSEALLEDGDSLSIEQALVPFKTQAM